MKKTKKQKIFINDCNKQLNTRNMTQKQDENYIQGYKDGKNDLLNEMKKEFKNVAVINVDKYVDDKLRKLSIN